MQEMRPGHLNESFNEAPIILVIFGVTGDLSQRKLIPALFHLFCAGRLPQILKIVGMARRELTEEGFHDFVVRALLEHSVGHEAELDAFLKHIAYHVGDFLEPESYRSLADVLISIEDMFGQCANKLFHLAVSPKSYDDILRELADSGLTVPCATESGWTRILVEKPFGNDNATAMKLDHTLGLLFDESQIFRIDHYLAKEALRDLLLFRFSNSIFEPLWNKDYIDRVEIKLFETLGVEGRGSFYDALGSLRDVGQNHLLQMLALVAMENPKTLVADTVRSKRASVLSHIEPIFPAAVVRGQYEGYRDEQGVASHSTTETYFRLSAYINEDRWRGVPFVLESGKALAQTKTEITIYFKSPAHCLCGGETHDHGNVLTFRIQPDEGIKILFWAKRIGFEEGLEARILSFSYRDTHDATTSRIPDAYERVLFDSFAGDQLLFASTNEVAAAWSIITPLIEAWHDIPLHSYKKGSMGPKEGVI
ncbi:MAG: glucose-6-phosphate dehydrogenase [Minisyncoccota bacterium]